MIALAALKGLWPAVKAAGPLPWIKLILVALLVFAGAMGGHWVTKIHWVGEYNGIVAAMEKQRADFNEQRVADEQRLNENWAVVYRLQQDYQRLNREVYDELQAKLDRVATDVRRYGDRVVRICPTAPATAAGGGGSAAAAGGSDGAPPRGLPGALEPDPGQGWGSGYDIFPETNALMLEAERNAIRCNGLIDYVEGITSAQ